LDRIEHSLVRTVSFFQVFDPFFTSTRIVVLRVLWFDLFFVFVTICGPERRKYTLRPTLGSAPDTGISKYVNIIARSAHFFARVRTLDARLAARYFRKILGGTQY
jgi:hypothetical protein